MAVEVFVAVVPAGEPDWMMQRLTCAEHARAGRFVHAVDRRAYVASHALLRVALDHVAGRFEQWRFDVDALGKPHVLSPVAQPFFSLSHTRGRVAVVVSRRGPVGVDVEVVDRVHALSDMDEAWLSAGERLALTSALDKDQGAQRLAWWVAKEALVKAVGLGLRQPLCELELPVFSWTDGAFGWLSPCGLPAAEAWIPAVHLPAAFGPSGSASWPLRVFRDENFCLGLAVHRPAAGEPAPAVIMHESSLTADGPVFTAIRHES
ncbi:hypothetical protein CR159_03435 [Pollutimonas subterranea]|uniref:4'-phosphopantetheinyl transferase domain-containing protein n=1 Tax=Pollutimonas subterranea TaxID=2045210 RepID=A0A2N4U8E7_9BURK|nr:4'-phosphopantetheinyl transferase superfamily protein [Pollutimonas subterranea]PLC51295.1 hypothetical protein CR159_03435 [Pollutimonas subterranea]